jgi:hypothetical protein
VTAAAPPRASFVTGRPIVVGNVGDLTLHRTTSDRDLETYFGSTSY